MKWLYRNSEKKLLKTKGLMHLRHIGFFILLSSSTGIAQCFNAPDLIIVNAHIITINPQQPTASAIAIRAGLIQAIGDEEEIVALIPENCPVQWIDAGGYTILPGFNDAHCHWLSWREHICDAPDEQFTEYPSLEDIMDTLSANGWTSISELNFGRPDLIPEHLENAMALEANGNLNVRLNGYWGTYDNMDLIAILQNYGYEPGHTFSPRIRTPGVKMYVDDPFGTMDIMDQTTCTQLVTTAHAAGYQVAAHCVNQSAVGKIITAYESVLGGGDNSAYRHRIEHAVKVSNTQFQRMEDKGIVASIQLMGPPDWPEQNTFQTYISNNNTDYVLRWRDFVESGIPVVGSTDAPFNNTVCEYSPFRVIYEAVTRIGYLDHMHAPWELDQRISIENGLRLLTINGAWVTKEENVKGSLETGKYADLTIVSMDPLSVSDPQELLAIQSLLTMVGGSIEYCHPLFDGLCEPVTAFRVDTTIVTVSNYVDDQRPGQAFDMDVESIWSAGDFPPQYIQIDLLKNTELHHVEMVIAQFPEGFTLHSLSATQHGESQNMEELHSFSGVTMDDQVLTYQFEPTNNTFRYLRIETLQSPSWVAWKEIRLYKEGSSSAQHASQNIVSLKVFPNPAIHGITLELDLSTAQKDLKIRVLTTDGRFVSHMHSGFLSPGKHQFCIDQETLEKVSKGSLLLIVEGEEYFRVARIVR